MATIPSSLTAPLKMGAADFKPWYTPKEMIELGVYGGIYFYQAAHKEGIPPEFFTSLPSAKWGKENYNSAINYFNVIALQRNRELQHVPAGYKARHAGWFHWYTQWSHGTASDTYINDFRIKQWKSEILTFSYYIENTTYSGGLTRYTDPAFLPEYKQHMLQFAWDPTRKPQDYGVHS